jgi:hypothetical protein
MALYVDDIAVDWPGENLGELLQLANERLEPAGRIIVEVVVNGESVIGDALMERQSEMVRDREVRLVTAEPLELTLATLRQVQEGLQSIREDQAQAAERFQMDEPAEGLKRVGNVLEAWLHLEEAVLHCAHLNDLDLDEMAIDGTPVKTMTDNLLSQFRELKELLSNGDLVGVADALAYEWPRTVDAWDRLLGEMIRQIEAK